MKIGNWIILPAAVLLTGLALGGCATTWDEVKAAFAPKSAPAPEAGKDVTADDIAALVTFETAAGGPDAEHPAARHIAELGTQVISVLDDGSVSKAERIAYFRQILARDLDIPLIARVVLGKHWRSATEQQRAAYMDAFAVFVVRTYSQRLGGFEVNAILILDINPVGERDVVVRSRVDRSGANAVRADWRFTNRGGNYRILDLSVEGVSMALMLRQEFASVIRAKGGLDGLVAALKERTA
ncbi:MAG: ABC transporter substrate-binding protein [Rhodospirillales bacterium]|jgi:phospholipid transport system substrate-binding protein|nr:ABC transporter substrate-binding protein [Rhodospirillales bacterium]MDP6806006.1 ABC transporter substrate-binding protein [Rhodospirillales bacterium]